MASPMLWTMRVIVVFTTWIMVFTPAPMLYKIFKTKSVGQAPIFPLAAMLASSHMWLLHGYINHNIFPAVMTFIVGDTVGLIYIAIYLRYTTERAYVVKVVGLTLVFLCAMSAFAFTAKNDNVVGPVAGVAALVLYGWPFERMQLVLQHKSNEYIPVVIVSRATLNNAMWIIYTALDGNWYTFAPHVISIVMGIAQLSLYYVHHPSRRVQNQHSATTVIDVEDARGRTVSIAIETPKTDLVASKLIPESPSFQLMHSPLAPLM